MYYVSIELIQLKCITFQLKCIKIKFQLDNFAPKPEIHLKCITFNGSVLKIYLNSVNEYILIELI